MVAGGCEIHFLGRVEKPHGGSRNKGSAGPPPAEPRLIIWAHANLESLACFNVLIVAALTSVVPRDYRSKNVRRPSTSRQALF